MLHRGLHDHLFVVEHLHKVHMLLNGLPQTLSLLQRHNALEVTHLVDEGVAGSLWTHHHLSLKRQLVERILVFQRKAGLFFQLP